MASKTGWTSVGELEMTRRISAVAVCCSSASLVSLNRRAFWIAITAWSAKVRSSSTSLSEKPVGGWRVTYSVPIVRPFQTIGTNTCE